MTFRAVSAISSACKTPFSTPLSGQTSAICVSYTVIDDVFSQTKLACSPQEESIIQSAARTDRPRTRIASMFSFIMAKYEIKDGRKR